MFISLKKRYKLITIWFISSLSIYSLFLYGKIDFDTIVMLSVVTSALIESIYDIKNRTVGEFSYNDSDPYSHIARYFIFIFTFLLFVWIAYDVFIELYPANALEV